MEELRPLNCSGSSEEEIGQLLSNLAHTPFTLDDVFFASVEAFYIAIRSPLEMLPEVAFLFGREAKNKGSKLKKKLRPTHGAWMGQVFELGSDAHHRMVKRAIRAKLEQNPDILRAFLATAGRPIIHDTGWPESRFTQLPALKFCSMLAELREELA